ncbi:amino acid--tRNA ligase-related protein [Actinacidiphila yeochonensis]|uniref:amino acid--tRNA ligase-related protein n=1 Tax=Actinacidiphila yeochonensis TaxID=89050 RepID=UPI00099BF707|nr:amino acid--tRNA ligase-related protein [Actinacidiphila yeochonensis]
MTEHLTRTISPSGAWHAGAGYHRMILANPWYRGVATLQNAVSELTSDFWRGRRARTMHLPVTTGSISSPMGRGSDSTPVSVDLGGVRTYLADSMQFMLELGCRVSGTDCYYVMPSFRGEPSDPTHLSQFFHSEAEIRGGLTSVIEVVQDYLRFVTAGLLEAEADLVLSLGGRLDHLERLAGSPVFHQLTFDEAADLLGPGGVEDHGGWRTLPRRSERELISRVGEFVWITHWDHLAVPFYQAFADGHRKRALNADLLFGPGEVVGAGERHRTAVSLREALRLHEVPQSAYEWYADMRVTDPLLTSGFGMGIERYLMWVLDHSDIRDLQLLPREMGKAIVP